jgi:SAM-dependent methyltransferase
MKETGPMTLYQSVDHQGWQAEDETWKGRQISALLHDFGFIPSSVADVGCGTGAVLAELSRLNPAMNVAGFDVAEIPIARARATYPHLPFSTGFSPIDEFEVKMLMDVVEHVRDCWELLEGARLTGYRLGFAPDAIVYYRYRSGLRQMARQCYAIGVNCERILRDFAFLGDGGNHHGDDARARRPGPA